MIYVFNHTRYHSEQWLNKQYFLLAVSINFLFLLFGQDNFLLCYFMLLSDVSLHIGTLLLFNLNNNLELNLPHLSTRIFNSIFRKYPSKTSYISVQNILPRFHISHFVISHFIWPRNKPYFLQVRKHKLSNLTLIYKSTENHPIYRRANYCIYSVYNWESHRVSTIHIKGGGEIYCIRTLYIIYNT
jgi:hypothetical protein